MNFGDPQNPMTDCATSDVIEQSGHQANDKSLIPVKLFPPFDPVYVRGKNDYAGTVGAGVHFPPLLIARRLLDAFPADFERASSVLSDRQWQLLYRVNQYNLFDLADPGFDPISTITEPLTDEETIAIAGEYWLPAGTKADVLAFEIRQNIDLLTADQSKALWVLLFLGRFLSHRYMALTDETTESVRWWDLPTLRGMLRQLPLWSVKQLERPRPATVEKEELL